MDGTCVLQCSIIIGSNGSASHPVGHSFHPLPQPGITQPEVTQPGVTQLGVAQLGVTHPHNTPQHIAAGFQMFGKLFLHHSIINVIFNIKVCNVRAGYPGATGYTAVPAGLPPPHYGHSQLPTTAQFPVMGNFCTHVISCIIINFMY